jgi:hypothetical protein
MIQLEVKHAAAQELGLRLELARFFIPLSIQAIPAPSQLSYVRTVKWCMHWSHRLDWFPTLLKMAALSTKESRSCFDLPPIFSQTAFFMIASLSDQRKNTA